MPKILIPEDLRGGDLYKFLIENKTAIIAEKKSMPQKSSPVSYANAVFGIDKGTGAVKAAGDPIEADASTVRVKVVCNSCWFCDDQMDVLIDNSAKRSLKNRRGMIPHLHDHIHRLDEQIGDVVDVYLEDISLRELGVNASGSTQCIIMESDVRREYNKRIFDLYKAKKVKQHSIGLWYVHIELAINSEEYEKELDFWNKYYSKIINKEAVDEKGFFWVVSEIKVIENSAVLFGSNELTGTLETDGQKDSSSVAQPQQDTLELVEDDQWNLDVAIRTTRFFKN